MLSRSNSNAGDRLRRAKSTSSTHTSSSAHQRSSTSIDPFVTRQQAEVAAVEAYHRARRSEEPTYQPYRPVPPRPQRRKSQVTGKTEGGHFEDARLGRRRSTSKKENDAKIKASRNNRQRQSDVSSTSNEEEQMIPWRGSAILPVSYDGPNYQHDFPSLPSLGGLVRQSRPPLCDGSPLPRHSSTLEKRSSTINMHVAGRNDAYIGNVANLSDSHAHQDDTIQSGSTPTAVMHGRPTDNIKIMVPDGEVKDFHEKKLRERKSFMLAPFQKRKDTNASKSSGSGYDTSLPPFNFADEQMPPLPPPEISAPTMTINSESKGRNFSGSFKGRIKNLFRRSSRVPSGVPPQQIEAKHFHYTTHSPLSTPTIRAGQDEDPFIVATNQTHLAAPDTRAHSASSKHSQSVQSNDKSRVTSWTNSTIAGTWSTRNDVELQDTADEQGRLRRSDSIGSIRRASSFFGRPIMNKLRRPSRAHLRGSDESDGLYSALQERMQPSVCETPASNIEQTASARTPSGLSSLPSQRDRVGSVVNSQSRWAAPTIRSVTPDPNVGKLDNLSPVIEAVSPEVRHRSFPRHAHQDDSGSEPTPRSQLQRRPAMKASVPSKEQIERRIERSKNRWQSPLDEISSSEPGPTRKATLDDNPYESRSLSRTLQQSLPNNPLPHHARIDERPNKDRLDVLSPSLYSRATDGESPRPISPMDQGGMVVTITGREVRSYSISPPKRDQRAQQPVQESGQWRRWLSDEMHGWDAYALAEGFALSNEHRKDVRPGIEAPANEKVETRHETSVRRTKPSGTAQKLDSENELSDRERPSNERSNFENERYPKVKAGRTTSAQSPEPNACTSTLSRTQEHGAVDQEQSVKLSTPGKMMDRPRVVRNHKSITPLGETAPRGESLAAPPSPSLPIVGGSHGVAAPAVKSKPASKAKSAFDLRATYKSKAADKAQPIEVHRKLNNNDNLYILEDSTIQNILAGPYANPQTATSVTALDANKENAMPSEANSLPSVSSSEWLAAGTHKVRDVRRTSTAYLAYGNRSASRYSPSRTGHTVSGGGSSPGQRLASNWLDGRRSKENSPTFV